jgi:condensin complex subunit 2
MMETIDIDKENEEFDSIAQKKFRSVKKKNRRRRRRSSARFLKLSPEDAEEDDAMLSTQNLSQVYQNAIRMNAENKINASNSWNLNLIDHLDRFVTSSGSSQSGQTQIQTDSTSLQAVNFTKASCTLDASVKIYSYRVDDVHLTSYKVLANLNRTETSNSKKLKVTGKNSEDTNTTQRRSELRKTETETLEQNLGTSFFTYIYQSISLSGLSVSHRTSMCILPT